MTTTNEPVTLPINALQASQIAQENDQKKLSWSEFGLLAYIEMRGDPTVDELEKFASNGIEGLRHLLRKLRDRELVELTRHTNERKQFTGGTYSIKKAA